MKKILAIVLSVLVFVFIGACNVSDSREEGVVLAWQGASGNVICQKSSANVTQVAYAKQSNDSNCYVKAYATGYKTSDLYVNLRLKASARVKVRAEFVYGLTDSETFYGEAEVGTENEVFCFSAGAERNGKVLSVIRVFPSVDSDASSGILYMGKVSFSNYYVKKCIDLKEKENTAEDADPVVPAEAKYLCEKYRNFFSLGYCADNSRFRGYSDVEKHFGSFTCENEMKPYTISYGDNFDYKNIGAYDFSKADEMLSYMKSRGIKVRGHALIWYNSCPGWLVGERNKAVLLDKIDTYCYNVVKHFKDKFGDTVYAWDVVNEVVSDDYDTGAGKNSMRREFYEVAGMDFIVTAFKAARRADPNVKLYINDYNITTESGKRKTYFEVIERLIDAGVPIDGVGFQSHYYDAKQELVSRTETAINELKSLSERKNRKLDLQITELDVKTNDNDKLAEFYDRLFGLYRKYYKDISNVTFWAGADDHTWLGNEYTPSLFDRNHQKKKAFDKVFNFE